LSDPPRYDPGDENDPSRSLTPFDPNHTLIAVISGFICCFGLRIGWAPSAKLGAMEPSIGQQCSIDAISSLLAP